MNAIWVLEGYDNALKSDDPKEVTRFLCHHCQDFITVIEQQKFVIELLNDIIADKDAEIESLRDS
jgi:hypothetical protein